MKMLKKIIISLSVMLLVGGACFAQQQEEFQRDSVWGISVDTTDVDMLVHFYFTTRIKPQVSITIGIYNTLEFEEYGTGFVIDAAFNIWIKDDTTFIESKHVLLEQLNDSGDFYEVVISLDKFKYWSPSNRAMRLRLGDFKITYELPSNFSALNDLRIEADGNYSHRYISMTGQPLSELPQNGFYMDCLVSKNDQMIECKKCMTR